MAVKDQALIENKKVFVSKPTFFRRLASFRNVLTVLILSFAVLTFFVRQFDYFQFDLNITRLIQSFNPSWFHFLMVIISRLGDVGLGSIIILIFAILAFLARKFKAALMIFIAPATTTVLSQIIKHLVSRPRPSNSLIQVIGFYDELDSFPSGHVMFYISLYGLLLFIVYTQFKKRLVIRRLLIGVFSLMIMLIGVSRIYLGAHWFSDVLGAYIIGFSWLMIIIYIYKKLEAQVEVG